MENKEKLYTREQEHIAQIAKALGHPARIAIMNFLAHQDNCFFGEIHEVLPIAKATVSQHLSELKNAGLIKGEIIQPKVKYCINKQSWIEAKAIFGELFDNCIAKRECCK